MGPLKELEIIRRAKADGVHVTAEATPHHFSLDHSRCRDFSPLFKMNPPLRSREDNECLLQALKDKDRVGIAKVAIREREHLASLRAIGDVLVLGKYEIPLQVADLNVGVLFIFAIASLGFAWYFYKKMMEAPQGTEKLRLEFVDFDTERNYDPVRVFGCHGKTGVRLICVDSIEQVREDVPIDAGDPVPGRDEG